MSKSNPSSSFPFKSSTSRDEEINKNKTKPSSQKTATKSTSNGVLPKLRSGYIADDESTPSSSPKSPRKSGHEEEHEI